jgi:integrase
MGSLYRRTQKMKDGTRREGSTWWIKYYQNGRPVRESTGTTKETVARRMLRVREGDVEHGIPINPKVGRVTFEDAAADLLNDYIINGKKSHDHAKRRIDLHLAPYFRGRRLANITTADIGAFIVSRLAARPQEDGTELPGASNGEINRELAVLKRMYTLAIRAGLLHAKPYIPKLQEDNVRKGFFEQAQLDDVCAHLAAPLRPVVRFAYLTGWRVPSEVLTLLWRQVDWKGRTVRLDPGTTKNRDGRTFPFTAALEALLLEQFADHERLAREGRLVPYVFHRDGSPIKDFRGAWETACTDAGVPGKILHDFRRSAVRNLDRAGVSRSAAMAIVGHKTESIYRRYSIVDDGALRDAAAKIDGAAGTISGTAHASKARRRPRRSA